MLLFAPGFATVDRLRAAFSDAGAKLESDGRPTLRMSARDLTALALDIDPQCMVIPAHVWTPWFGLFGSKSGFDHLEECFLDMAPQIHHRDRIIQRPGHELEHPRAGRQIHRLFLRRPLSPKIGAGTYGI